MVMVPEAVLGRMLPERSGKTAFPLPWVISVVGTPLCQLKPELSVSETETPLMGFPFVS